jgi:hypothetical protein
MFPYPSTFSDDREGGRVMKPKKLYVFAVTLLVASMLLGACAPSTPAAAPAEAPAEQPPAAEAPAEEAAEPAEEAMEITLAIQHFSVIGRPSGSPRSTPTSPTFTERMLLLIRSIHSLRS